MLQRELHLGLLGMILDCEGSERESNCQGFFQAAMSSSSSVKQLPCARSNSLLDYKSSSMQLHHHMEKRELDHQQVEELAATCLCARALFGSFALVGSQMI